MLLMTLTNFILLQQTVIPHGDNVGGWFQYGLAGVLAFLIYLLLKYIKQRDKHDQELAKERSQMYREDNEIRDERYAEVVKKSDESFAKALISIDLSGQRFVEATNNNIEKFIQLVNKVMEQGNYQTQVLTELKSIISKLPSEFQSLKKDINDHLEKLGINYELKKKDEQ